MSLTQQVQSDLVAAHALRCSPHPWTGHRSPAAIKPTASADTESEFTELAVGVDIPGLCTYQGHGKKHFLLPKLKGNLSSCLFVSFFFPSWLSPFLRFLSSSFLPFLHTCSSPRLFFFTKILFPALCTSQI